MVCVEAGGSTKHLSLGTGNSLDLSRLVSSKTFPKPRSDYSFVGTQQAQSAQPEFWPEGQPPIHNWAYLI